MHLPIRWTPFAVLVTCSFCFLGPSSAIAAECTATWSGPSEGNWASASNWSPEQVPDSSDVVCVGVGNTATISSGASEAGILQVDGTLAIAGGSLQLSEVPSTVATLTLSGGALDSEGEVLVAKSFVASGGSIEGSGSTVIGSEASGKVESGGNLTLAERELKNNGTFTVEGPTGRLTGEDGATVVNAGTMIVNAEGSGNGLVVGEVEPAPKMINTGVLRKTESKSEASSPTLLAFEMENEGTVETKSGVLELTGGGISGKSSVSHWIALSENLWAAKTRLVFAQQSFQLGEASITGEVQLVSGTAITADRVEGSEGSIWLYEGDLQLLGKEASSLGELGVASGTASLPPEGELSTAGLEVTAAYAEEAGVKELKGLPEMLLGSGSTVNTNVYIQDLGSTQMGNEATLNGPHFVEGGTFNAGNKTTFTGFDSFATGGSFTTGTETNFLIDEAFVSGGSFNLGSYSTVSGDYFFQESGSTTFGPFTDITESEFIYIEEGSMVFEQGIEATMPEMFFQQGGETTFGANSVLEAGEMAFFETGPSDIGTGASITADEIVVQETNMSVGSGAVVESEVLDLYEGELAGAGAVLADELIWHATVMAGSGLTEVREKGRLAVDGNPPNQPYALIDQRRLVTDGTFSLGSSTLAMSNGARVESYGEFDASSQNTSHGPAQITVPESSVVDPKFINYGEFKKKSGLGTTMVAAPFESFGSVHELSGNLVFSNAIGKIPSDLFGLRCKCGDPVEPATGNLSETQVDFSAGGRGAGLELSRTYSVYAATTAPTAGMFGYGWSSSFSDHLDISEGGGEITVVRGDGSTIPFIRNGEGQFEPPIWSQAALIGNPEAGYIFTTLDQIDYAFSPTGQLASVTDRNGNETVLSYNEQGWLETVASQERDISFTYYEGGLVKTVTDPMGQVFEYDYEGKELVGVTFPGEELPRWQFDYDASHRLTAIVDGRGGETVNEYDEANRVISQTDPANHTLSFEYEPFHTTITNVATGAITDLWFTSNNTPFAITHGFGTPEATTQRFVYDEAGRLLRETDGNGHTTSFGYNAAGDQVKMVDANENETKWEYNAAHDLISETTPEGTITTIERDANGNPETVSRPAPEESVQVFSYDYAPNGDLESATDPLERTWQYEYDGDGNLEEVIEPDNRQATFSYNDRSELVSFISPGAIKTTIERDLLGRPEKVFSPLGTINFTYDANGNLKTKTNSKGASTKFTYSAVDELIKTEWPSGASIETNYDGTGHVISRIDGNENETTYVRNSLGQPVEVIDALNRKTLQSFDDAGNIETVTDPAERVTSYAYDPADRLKQIFYSDEATPDVSFEHDGNGNLVGMVDGSGETSYVYDQLDRLTEATNGNNQTVAYDYNLANEQEQITYPNGKDVGQSFDEAGRLESITDWLGNTTVFDYDDNSNVEAIQFPSKTGNIDEFEYDSGRRRVMSVFMKKGEEGLASVMYERNALRQVIAEVRAGLPGGAEETYEYDKDNRLVKAGGGSFEYDDVDNPIKTPTSSNSFDKADQLESGTGVTYEYNDLGERIKATPAMGPATNYAYNQAGALTAVNRAAEEEVAKIDETFAYDGAGLLASRKVGETSKQFAWDASKSLPLILDDGTASYIYGPDGLPIEQIDSEEAPSFYHHDQLGSTRILTDATGQVTGRFTYHPYGALKGATGSQSTPLGYAGQYTTSQSELQYLRARFYDPATTQFLSVDPLYEFSHARYGYAYADPLNLSDPSGLFPSPSDVVDAVTDFLDPCSLATGLSGISPYCMNPQERRNTAGGAIDQLLAPPFAGIGPVPEWSAGPFVRNLVGFDDVEECSLEYRTARDVTAGARVVASLPRVLRVIEGAKDEAARLSRHLDETFVHIRKDW